LSSWQPVHIESVAEQTGLHLGIFFVVAREEGLAQMARFGPTSHFLSPHNLRLRRCFARPQCLPLRASGAFTLTTMSAHHDHANLIWQIADLLCGPYRRPRYERVTRTTPIVVNIASETEKLDRARTSAERTIALLKERRAALIEAVGTGKTAVPIGPVRARN